MRGLVYLYKLAEAYVVYTQYYEPDELDQKMIIWPDIRSEQGTALTRFNAKKDVCTFYSSSSFGITLLSHAFNFTDCLPYFRFGKRNEKRHHEWHNSKSEFSDEHMHLIKSPLKSLILKEKFELVTPEELACFFQNLKKFETTQGLCLDGPDTCLVTDEDAVIILERYTAFHNEKLALNEQLNEKFQRATQLFYADLQEKCLNASKSFAHAFATTLLDKYFQPYLLTQGVAYNKAITESLKSLLTLLMTQSLVSTMTESMLRNGLKPVLMKLGLNLHVVERILSSLGTAVAFAQNPLSLVDLGLNGVAAISGEKLAYRIIHALPKLKVEPVDNAVYNEATVTHEQRAGIRRRNVG